MYISSFCKKHIKEWYLSFEIVFISVQYISKFKRYCVIKLDNLLKINEFSACWNEEKSENRKWLRALWKNNFQIKPKWFSDSLCLWAVNKKYTPYFFSKFPLFLYWIGYNIKTLASLATKTKFLLQGPHDFNNIPSNWKKNTYFYNIYLPTHCIPL